MYLFNMLTTTHMNHEFFKEFCKENKITFDLIRIGLHVSSEVRISFGDFNFYLQEFPGNCSSLILSNIQDILPYRYSSVISLIKIIVDLCERAGYGALFISLTSESVILQMEEFGFKRVYSLLNPHSEKMNTFMVLEVKRSIIKEQN